MEEVERVGRNWGATTGTVGGVVEGPQIPSESGPMRCLVREGERSRSSQSGRYSNYER